MPIKNDTTHSQPSLLMINVVMQANKPTTLAGLCVLACRSTMPSSHGFDLANPFAIHSIASPHETMSGAFQDNNRIATDIVEHLAMLIKIASMCQRNTAGLRNRIPKVIALTAAGLKIMFDDDDIGYAFPTLIQYIRTINARPNGFHWGLVDVIALDDYSVWNEFITHITMIEHAYHRQISDPGMRPAVMLAGSCEFRSLTDMSNQIFFLRSVLEAFL